MDDRKRKKAVRFRVGACMFAVLLLSVLPQSVRAQGYYRDPYQRLCPVLDVPYRTFQGVEIRHTMAADSQTEGWGDSVSVTDVNLWGRWASLENDYGGELEIRGHLDFRILEGFAAASGMDRLHTLGMARVGVIWHQRFLGGVGMQLRAFPGLYGALDRPDSDVFGVPFGGTMIYAFTPDVALFGGLDVYPGFGVGVDPVLGVVYSYLDTLRLQFAYPETELRWSPFASGLSTSLGATFARWPEYSLGKGDERDRMRMMENRFSAGLSWETRSGTEVAIRGGYVQGRRVRFDGDAPGVTLDDSPFVMIGFSGLL